MIIPDLLVVLCLYSSITVAEAAIDADLVTALPGTTFQPAFKHYSGYLRATETRHLHYWFTESSGSPGKDPVVLWLNGGPGCSSMDGMLSEHGPFRVSTDGKSISLNPHSWNKIANMLYLEAPACVGYSYADDKNCTTSDDQVASDNHMALKYFFKNFPEFSGNEFYITGESYGGVYVPTLSALVLQDSSIKFKGSAIGNGLSAYDVNTDTLIYFAYYHGVLGVDLWGRLTKFCCEGGHSDNCDFAENLDPDCQNAVESASMIISTLNIYNLYAECYHGNQTSSRQASGAGLESRFHPIYWIFPKVKAIQDKYKALDNISEITLNMIVSHGKQKRGYVMRRHGCRIFADVPRYIQEQMPYDRLTLSDSGQIFQDIAKQVLSRAQKKVTNVPPCIDATGMTNYLNRADVRKALHIQSSLPEWEICNGDIDYRRQYLDMKSVYLHLLSSQRVRILVYNGDADMACNFLGDEWFVNSLNQTLLIPWKEWMYPAEDGSTQVAGFVKQYKNINFVTVKGAGHMVPGDKPIPAFVMFQKFLKNEAF